VLSHRSGIGIALYFTSHYYFTLLNITSHCFTLLNFTSHCFTLLNITSHCFTPFYILHCLPSTPTTSPQWLGLPEQPVRSPASERLRRSRKNNEPSSWPLKMNTRPRSWHSMRNVGLRKESCTNRSLPGSRLWTRQWTRQSPDMSTKMMMKVRYPPEAKEVSLLFPVAPQKEIASIFEGKFDPVNLYKLRGRVSLSKVTGGKFRAKKRSGTVKDYCHSLQVRQIQWPHPSLDQNFHHRIMDLSKSYAWEAVLILALTLHREGSYGP
jgi:hypothetical protein